MKENKKTEVLQIRFTPEEKGLLQSLSRRSGMSMAEYVQTLISLKYIFRFSDRCNPDAFEFLNT